MLMQSDKKGGFFSNTEKHWRSSDSSSLQAF